MADRDTDEFNSARAAIAATPEALTTWLAERDAKVRETTVYSATERLNQAAAVIEADGDTNSRAPVYRGAALLVSQMIADAYWASLENRESAAFARGVEAAINEARAAQAGRGVPVRERDYVSFALRLLLPKTEGPTK